MNVRFFGRRRVGPAPGDPTPGIPAVFLLRRDRTLRYRRGGTVHATDGRVGVLERVVVDEAAGAIVELVVRLLGSRRAVVVPADLVAMTANGRVFLRESRERFAERVATAAIFDKRGYAAANLRALVTNGGRMGQADPRRGVLRAGRDFVETPGVVPRGRGERRTIAQLEPAN